MAILGWVLEGMALRPKAPRLPHKRIPRRQSITASCDHLQPRVIPGRPDDADRGGHADVEGAEVQGGEEEAERAALHGRLDGDRAAGPLVVAHRLGREEAEDASGGTSSSDATRLIRPRP